MVYKRGRIWWMRLSYQGQQIRRSTKKTSKKEAQDFEKCVESALKDSLQPIPEVFPKRTFSELMDRYLKEHSKIMKSPSSYRRDLSLAEHLCKAFGDQPIHQIRSAMIVNYKTQRRKEGAAPRTINLELGLMRHAFNKALKEYEWVERNPVSHVSRERVTTTLERWLREDEERRLLAASPVWLRDVIVFAVNNPFREIQETLLRCGVQSSPRYALSGSRR